MSLKSHLGKEIMNFPYLQPRLPDSIKWRILGALLKLDQRPHTEKTRSAILGALGAINIAAAYGVSGGRISDGLQLKLVVRSFGGPFPELLSGGFFMRVSYELDVLFLVSSLFRRFRHQRVGMRCCYTVRASTRLGYDRSRDSRRVADPPGRLRAPDRSTDGYRAAGGDLYGPNTEWIPLNQAAVVGGRSRALRPDWV